MRSQVTTKRGDKGTTVTLAGDTLSKSDPILECCGQLDTVRTRLALCRARLLESNPEEKEVSEFLLWVVHVCFLIGTECNDPKRLKPEYRKAEVGPDHLTRLEAFQDKLEETVRLPKQFVAVAQNSLAAEFDVLTTDIRALERRLVALKAAEPEFRANPILAYINRLSDTAYLLARKLDNGDYCVVDYSLLGAE